MHTPKRTGWRWLIALIAAAAFNPFLATTASAATPRVTFSGTPLLDVGTASCPSTPDVKNLTVVPGGSVGFINHTGENAILHVGGTQLAVANGGIAAVVFHGSGDRVVTMIPDCQLDVATHEAMTVAVCAAQTAPMPPPPASGSRPSPSISSTGRVQPVSQTHAASQNPTPMASVSATVTPDVQAMPAAIDPPTRRGVNPMLIGLAVASIITVSVVWIVCARRAWSR